MGQHRGQPATHEKLWLVLLEGVEVRRGARRLSLGPPQQRAVLCALAFRPRQWVSPSTLLAALYDDDVPASGVRVIQTYVSALRRIVEPDRQPQSSPTVLVSGHGGYQLRIDDENVDLAVFNRLVNEAAQDRERGSWHRAHQKYHQALALCGDEPLAGIPGPYAELQRTALVERRLGVLEDHLDLAVSLGRADQVIDQLRHMIAEQPLRERPRAVLMRALYSRGRRAEALEVYIRARQVLVEQLGVEPSAELRSLHSRILAGETMHCVPPVVTAGPTNRPPTAHSPVDVSESATPVAGRDWALTRIATVAGHARQGRGGLALICGPPGCGKTRLLAEIARREPDARRIDLSTAPLSESGVGGLPAALLQALGFGGHPVPGGEPRLADRIVQALIDISDDGRLVLLVDNVGHTDQQSVRVLSLLVARLRTAPILLVLALDEPPWDGSGAEGHAVLEAEATMVIRLGGLDESTVADLVAHETGRACPEALATEIHRATAGIPRLVYALIIDLAALPEPHSVPTHLPGSGYSRALRQQLDHYPPGVTEILRALAVLRNHHPSVDLLAAIAGASVADVQHHSEFLTTLGLLSAANPPTFRHPLIANTLRWSCGRETVDALWLAAASHARAAGDPARRIAGYLRQLTNANGTQWIPVLMEAAHECLREDATQEAVGHLETALRFAPAAGRTELLVRVAQVEQWIDPGAAQAHLEEALLTQRATKANPTAAMPLVWLTSSQGQPEAAMTLLDEVISETEATDPAIATALRASTWMIAARTPATWARFLATLRARAAVPRSSPDPITAAVLALDDAFAVRCSAQEVLERFPAEHNGNRDWDRLPRELIGVLANITLFADDLTSTLQLCDRTADRHFGTLDLYRLTVRAEALYRQGKFLAVLRECALLESAPLRQASRRPIGLVSQYSHALLGLGRIDEAERWLDSIADHTNNDDSWEWANTKYAQGRVNSARGAAKDAAACFLDCGRRNAAWGMHNPGYMPWRSLAALELHKAGEHHRARELASAELDVAQRWCSPRTLGLAWRAVAITSADEAEKVPLLERAVDHFRRGESVIELVQALIDLADVHAATNRPHQERAALSEASVLAAPTDAAPLLERIDHRLCALRHNQH